MNKHLWIAVAQSKDERVASDLRHILSLSLPHHGRGSRCLCVSVSPFAKCKVLRDLYYLVVSTCRTLGLLRCMQGPTWSLNSCWNVSRSRIWLNEVSQITVWEWVLLHQVNVMAGVIYLETCKMFSEKVTVSYNIYYYIISLPFSQWLIYLPWIHFLSKIIQIQGRWTLCFFLSCDGLWLIELVSPLSCNAIYYYKPFI